MATGTVKWFSNVKGYGFLNSDDAENPEEDIFAHYSEINMDGYRKLKSGQIVEFDLITDSPKGLQALNIKAVAESDEQI
ncbi:MAG: cold shock domain-containing protein [Gammaproteobacteria bacterium]|nr:cold shock domain-containing protein [Gammaproteobacteria bacterium]